MDASTAISDESEAALLPSAIGALLTGSSAADEASFLFDFRAMMQLESVQIMWHCKPSNKVENVRSSRELYLK